MTENRPTEVGALSSNLVRRIVLASVLFAVVLAALSAYYDVQAADFVAIAPEALVVAFALALGNYVLRLARWQYYTRLLGFTVPLGANATIFFAGFIMSVTPGKFGEVLKSLMLHEAHGLPIARTAPMVVAERLTDLIALVLLTALGSMAFEGGPAVAAAGAVLAGLMWVTLAYPPVGRWGVRVARRLPLTRRFAPRLEEALEALGEMTRPLPMGVGGAIGVLAWGLECAALYVIVHGFAGVHISWDGATFAYAASTIAGAVAMLPGGLGVTEVGMTSLLSALAWGPITPALATAATLFVRLATLWFAVALGVLALGIYRLQQRAKRAASDPLAVPSERT